MRKTYCIPAEWSNMFFRQDQLNEMWKLIEDKYEERWRVHYNGDLIFVLDDAMLERVLDDNIKAAWYTFGSNKGGLKDGKQFFLNRPEHLKGEYIIKGVYTYKGHLITPENQKREYLFIQE